MNAIVLAITELRGGSLTIDQAIFEPKELIELLRTNSVPTRYSHDTSFTLSNADEVASVLQVVFQGWIDFIFIPEPKTFAIYADHEEYATFFAHSRSNLNRVVSPLEMRGFKAVQNYARKM